jgi:hypothetical protein
LKRHLVLLRTTRTDVIKNNKINPLNVVDIRRVEYCPPYFETVEISPNYNLLRALNDWIFENMSGRYYIANTAAYVENNPIKQKIKIGFENPSELSYFMLACPHLKYRT